jgi:putative transposase
MFAQTSFKFMSHGGPRENAGRPRLQLHDASHAMRQRMNARNPFHVTFRLGKQVPNLRNEAFIRKFTRGIEKARNKGLNVNHFTIESTHIHFMGETEDNEALTRGILSLQACIVWALRQLFGFFGAVFAGRFHLHVLKSPREVRNALLYVIFNHAKHCNAELFADVFSSAFAFQELRDFVRRPGQPPRWQNEISRALAPAKSWLQTVGWKR